MFQHCWLSLAIVGQFLFFAITAPPHTVHHGLHDGDAQGCPIATVTTETNGDLPDIVPLPTPLPVIVALPTLYLNLPGKVGYGAHRSRAPPLNPLV